jgi:carbon starvation protein
MIILLAVLALVVVNALAESPWGVFTVAATIPIAMLMGGYLRYLRVGKVMEVSIIGAFLLMLAVWGGQYVHEHETVRHFFKLEAEPLAWAVIGYGLLASILPVWLLLAPRDYLSTFMKLGTIFALALGVILVLPVMQMPAVSQFIDGSGPVVPGKLFPFCFITIACGAISGFHTLISSGITPKIITRESYARPVGYGAMCLESLVAIMAMIAACTLDPGVYLAMNIKGTAAQVTSAVNATGFNVDPASMAALAKDVGEDTLFGRTGGAATLAVGMANIFSKVTGGRWLDLWYHFAIMFEALFILTTLDAGTRVGRYLLQDALGHVWKPLGNVQSVWASVVTSVLIVAAWGAFLIMGVRDPEGGVKALWPIFGIANQLLASIALCLGTTIILKMSLKRDASNRRPALALVTLIPLVWLLAVTGTAAIQKVFHPSPRVGFMAAARAQDEKLPALQGALASLPSDAAPADRAAAAKAVRDNRTVAFNNRVDTAVTAAFLALVTVIVILSIREWLLLLRGRIEPTLHETDPVYLPADSVLESRPAISVFGMIAFGCTLLKELSGQAAIDREGDKAVCECKEQQPQQARRNAFLLTTERRYQSINRCC